MSVEQFSAESVSSELYSPEVVVTMLAIMGLVVAGTAYMNYRTGTSQWATFYMLAGMLLTVLGKIAAVIALAAMGLGVLVLLFGVGRPLLLADAMPDVIIMILIPIIAAAALHGLGWSFIERSNELMDLGSSNGAKEEP